MEKKDNTPLVSVVMATYNEPKVFIQQAIDSILQQSYKNLELIIADDSTSFETIETINAAAATDSRVKIIRKDTRMGLVAALNYALQEARGELIARMDGDDISIIDRIEKQVAFAAQHPDIAFFGGSMYIFNEKGEIISERHYPTTQQGIKQMLVYRNAFAHPTIMLRRRIIDNGYVYDTSFKKAEDLELFLRLYKNGYKFGNLPNKLLKYRVVGNLGCKRAADNWYYNHKARTKNFIFSKPVFSVLSWVISLVYKHTPKIVISYLYQKENSKKIHTAK